mgnify:CR=1 FL=1|tara:strand:- start:69 stop:617 length:549 start_codon:yes stop_codon:yes gene_type:complete
MKITKARLKQIINEELELNNEAPDVDSEKLDVMTSEDGMKELKRVLTLRLDVSDKDATTVAHTFIKSIKADRELYLTAPEQLLSLAKELGGERFEDMIMTALDSDMDDVGTDTEALTEEKDEWPKKLKKGRFTEWCKRNGFEDGASTSCAKKAMDSEDASVRGMASFYMNTVKPKGKDASDL